MARWNRNLIAGLGVLVLGVSNAALAVEDESETGSQASAEIEVTRFTSIINGLAHSTFMSGGLNRPKLYDNTSRCTVNVQALAVGGSTFPENPLSLLDYFVTEGGTISAFDLYLLNGGGDPAVGSGPQPLSEFKFYAGSDSTQIGTAIPGGFFRTLRQGGTLLPPIPVHVDANGVPLMIKVTVDYDARTYNVTDAATGTPLIDSDTGLAIVDEDIGTRPRITLPAGKAGVLLRLGGEWSVCSAFGGILGDPQAGPVLAGGGSGAEDGLLIINADQCATGLRSVLCDNPGWTPTAEDPTPSCSGGNVCSLNRPFNGIMMTLFMGPSEEGEGDNTAATAQTLNVGSPGELSPEILCVSELVTVNSFLGNNSQPSVIFDAPCFDGAPSPDGDGNIDLLDWGMMQVCFGQDIGSGCRVFDANNDDAVTLDDFGIFQDCTEAPGESQCNACAGEGPPVLLADVDIYRIPNLSSGDVVEVLLEGTKSPVTGSLWDPFLRIWALNFSGELELLETSDNYGRVFTDSYTTVTVPAAVNTVFVGVSASENSSYEPDDPASIESLCPDGGFDPLKVCANRAGGYALTVGVVDPDCIEIEGLQCDNRQGERFDTGIHEPDDTMADADNRGSLTSGEFIVFGAMGDGAFGGYGQDVDIYKIELVDTVPPGGEFDLSHVRRVTALVPGIAGAGFASVFDMAIGLYDSRGVLLGAGDQKSTSQQAPGNDQSRPQMAATVCGTNVPAADCPLRFAEGQEQDGIYYIALFGTNRGVFADTCDANNDAIALSPATPPSRLNFPHDSEVARTQNTDLRPNLVGGRVNLPGEALEGPNPLNCSADLLKHQCYRINILTSNNPLVNQQGFDDCEGRFVDGAIETDDSVFDACEVVGFGTRLSEAPIEKFWLGNGPYGGWQGDADFHRLSVEPGQVVSVNISDMEQPATVDHPIRSYLAFYDGCGNILATQDYSLEQSNRNPETGLNIGDGIINEIAANITIVAPELPVVPCSTPSSNDMYVMVGIDNGNMLLEENTPFDAAHPGTTLSRRFETNLLVQRRYAIGVTVLDPVTSVDPALRVFATPVRGLDSFHTSCILQNNNALNGSPSCWPSILELDPKTGQTLQVLDGGEFFRTRRNAQGVADFVTTEFVSANPLLAYDGRHLWIAVESCAVGANFCNLIARTLYKLDPDLLPNEFGHLNLVGAIEGLDQLRTLTDTGMVELNGFLYLLDNQDNEQCQENDACYGLRWWNKEDVPLAGVGGRTQDLTELSGDGPNATDEFDFVFGDMGTDGEMIYMPCSFEGVIQGLCAFTHNPLSNIVEFMGIFAEPVTNLEDTDNDDIKDLTPGPQIGGFDFFNDTMIASDRNGSIIQYWDMIADTVTGLKLPREFVVHRITAKLESD